MSPVSEAAMEYNLYELLSGFCLRPVLLIDAVRWAGEKRRVRRGETCQLRLITRRRVDGGGACEAAP